MKNPVFFTSGKGNHYLYSPFGKQLRLCHPLIPYFHTLDKKKTLAGWFSSVSGRKTVDIPELGKFTAAEIKYQLGKYQFLKKNGFLKPAQTINIKGRLKPSDIRKNLSSVKQVIFEVTEDCNLSCTYCTYSRFYVNKERSNRYLSFEDVRYTLTELISRRRPSPANRLIISFYGGEPLKNFSFVRSVVEFTQPYPNDRINFTYSLSTNGLLLKKYIEFLVQHAFEVSVSLDGDELANSFRLLKNEQPSFAIVTKNLDYVREHYPDYFEKNISFLTVLHNRNSYRAVFDFFQRRYGKTPQLSDVNPINLNPIHEREFQENIAPQPLSPREEQETVRLLEARHPKVREMARMTQNYSGFVFKNYLELLSAKHGRNSARKFIPTATCTPFSIRSFFTADGNVLPCEHISPFYSIGKFSSRNLGVDPGKISRLYNRYYEKISRYCDRCYFIDNCQECLFNTGIETQRTVCSFYTRESGFREYLKKNYSSIENDYPFYLKTSQAAFYEG